MRLTKQQAADATAELLDLVRRHPGIRTSGLVGTKKNF